MPDYVLADGAEDDLEDIAEYTITRWGVDQTSRYATTLKRHFGALAAGDVTTKPVFEHWPELRVSRCQHHYVFSLRRAAAPIAILAVFHENMDLPERLRERLDQEGQA
jgi:plasmid stabilization system protein ParE